MPKKDFYQVSLKAILRNDQGEVLILGGASPGTFAGYFDFPGGRIDTNEFSTLLADILRREIKEELQIENVELSDLPVAIGRHEIEAHLTPDNKPIHVLYIFFEGRIRSGQIVISAEHSSVRWVNLKSVDTKKLFTSGILEAVEMYLRRS